MTTDNFPVVFYAVEVSVFSFEISKLTMTLTKQLARFRKRILRPVEDPVPAPAAALKPKPKPPLKPAPKPAAVLMRPAGLELALNRARLAYTTAILHVSDGPGAEFHIDLWIQHLRDAVGPNVFVVIRSRPLFDLLKNRSDIECVYVRDAREAERLVYQCPELKAVFYVSNTGNVIHFIRLNHLSHVFLGHGDSDKAASCHRFFRVYDEVWTAGQAHIDRFTEAGFRTSSIDFKVIGRPGMRGVLDAPAPAEHERFLYLPTWEGYQDSQNYSSLLMGADILAAAHAATGLAPRVKFHPLTGSQSQNPVYRERSLRDRYVVLQDAGAPEAATSPSAIEIYQKQRTIAEAVQGVSFLISDISSVVTDFLVTLKPIFLFQPRAIDIKMSPSQVPYESYTYQFSTADELQSLIEQVIVRGDDPLAGGRRAALSYFVDVEATLEDRFGQEARRLCSDGPALSSVSAVALESDVGTFADAVANT